MSLGIIVSIGCFNATGVAITKFASAAQRSTVDTCRTLCIWVISLILGWEDFYALELIGFVMLVGGTLVYNEIVIVPIHVFSANTKANLKKNNRGIEKFRQDGKDPDYAGVSPAAPYDQNRMIRNIENKYNARLDNVEDHNDQLKLVNHSEQVSEGFTDN